MVYVVERYLPGLSRSDLLRGLSRLEQLTQREDDSVVRYLGSTIVLGDEACFCQFEGPSEAAVADANRKAGLSFDRIVPAVSLTPTERSSSMAVSTPTPVPATIEMRRSRLVGLLAVVAVAAAAITWAVYDVTMNGDGGSAPKVVSPDPLIQSDPSFMKSISALGQAQQASAIVAAVRLDARGGNSYAAVALDPRFRRFAQSISAISQAQQKAAVLTALGLDAQDRQYLLEITSPTPGGQVAAGR